MKSSHIYQPTGVTKTGVSDVTVRFKVRGYLSREWTPDSYKFTMLVESVEVVDTADAAVVNGFVIIIGEGVVVDTAVVRSSVLRSRLRGETSPRIGLDAKKRVAKRACCRIVVEAIDHSRVESTDIDTL